jgi:LPXTG-motif cell wall-anchored protein
MASRRRVSLIAVVALAISAGTPTAIAQGASSLSPGPPSSKTGSAGSKGSSGAGDHMSPAPVVHRLPATGADAGLLALAGCGLLLTGAGLRLRLREPAGAPVAE